MTEPVLDQQEDVCCPAGTTRAYQVALVAVILAGIGCRVAQYLANPSIWHDEALVAMNVFNKTLPQLLGPLDYAQAAPPLFLFAERGLVLAWGRSEYVLRLVSLVCGVAALPLFALLCWRLLPAAVAPWMAAFFAFADKLIEHSAQVKQYSGDALVAVLLLFLALGLKRPWSAGRRLALLAGVTAVGAWFSFPALLVFAGLSLLFLPELAKRGRTGWLTWLGCNALVGLSLLLLHHFSVRAQHVAFLSNYWAEDFPDYARPWTIPLWLVQELYGLCDHPYRSFGWLIGPLAVLGAWHWRRQGRNDVLGACLWPIGMAVVAAALKQYPFNGSRLTIYLVPGLFLLCGGGLAALRDWSSAATGLRRLAWVAVGLVVVGRGVIQAGTYLVEPRSRSGVRPAVAYVREHRQAGEGLYLIDEQNPVRGTYTSPLALELLCYWPEPPPPWRAGMPQDLRQIPETRFWIVFTSLPQHGTQTLEPLLRQLAPLALERDRYLTPGGGGAAILLERRSEQGS